MGWAQVAPGRWLPHGRKVAENANRLGGVADKRTGVATNRSRRGCHVDDNRVFCPIMTTDPMTDDKRLVATAYRQEMLAGHGDQEAYDAAIEAYLARYPEKPSDIAALEVARLIFEASSAEDGRKG